MDEVNIEHVGAMHGVCDGWESIEVPLDHTMSGPTRMPSSIIFSPEVSLNQRENPHRTCVAEMKMHNKAVLIQRYCKGDLV